MLSLAAPKGAAQAPVPGCDNPAGREVFGELFGTTTGSFSVRRATDRGFVGGGPIQSRPGCDFIWEINGNIDPGSPADIVCTRGQAPCNDPRGLYLLHISSDANTSGDVYLYGPLLLSAPSATFYSPYTSASASPDVGFGIFGDTEEVKAPRGSPKEGRSSANYYENVLFDDYVMPYDHQTYRDQGGADAVRPGFFLTKVATNCPLPQFTAGTCGTDPLSYRFAPEGDSRLPGTGSYAWDLTGVTLSFGPMRRLILDQPITITGGAFAAQDALFGWGGITFPPTPNGSAATSTLSGVTVSGVRTFLPMGVYPATEDPFGAAVTVINRSVVITGNSLIERGDAVNSGGQAVPDGTVLPTNGVQVTGLNGRLTVTGLSRVQKHGGVGVLATGGGIAAVTGQANASVNGYGGVLSTGYRSNVGVSGYAQVNNNLAPGVRATQQGFASVRSAGGSLLNTSASSNRGGLYTGSGAGIDAQQCDGSGTPTRPNQFESNFTNAFDASAFGGSVVSAPYAFWGFNRSSLVTAKDKPSTLALYPLAPNLNTSQPGCAVVNGGERAAPGAGFASVLDGDDAAQARGQVTDAVALLAAQARRAAWAGDLDAAFAQIDAARAASLTEDDREAVSEATAALLADEQPADVVAGLAATAATPGTDQAWAQRALAIAYAAGDRAADADALALALSGSSDAVHAAFGHGLLVRLATDAGSETAAVDRLTAFAATAPDADALGSSVALVAATFPDADLSGVLGSAGRSAGRSATAGTAPAVASRTAEAAMNALDVYPNPAASGQAMVRVTLTAATTSATATVYDALGRQVAVLHAGSLAAGPSEFALGSLAPGVYVVHVRTASEAGGVWTDVRRITVTR